MNLKKLRRLERACRAARQYLQDCDSLLDGVGESRNPKSGVGGIVAKLSRALGSRKGGAR